MPVRNEDWILGLGLRALLRWVDHAIVLDHCSTDDTAAILSDIAGEYPGRVTVLLESDPVWEEMRHRQRLLDTAREKGATHIVVIDADEILTGDLLPAIRGMVEACPANQTMQLPWLCLRNSKDLVHTSGVWGEQWASMGFVDNPSLFWSAEGRGTYDHHHRAPMGRTFSGHRPFLHRSSGLLHFQFVNEKRLKYKQLAYQLIERTRWPNRETAEQVRRKYALSIYGRDTPPAVEFGLAACPDAWLAPYADLMHHYRPEAEPWQAQQCRDLIAANPSITAGLDDFGLELFGR